MRKWKQVVRALTFRRQRKQWRNRLTLKRALRDLADFPRHADAPRHGLPARLIVSLTSYPARFHSLHLTIKSLLDQSVRPDQLFLWIARDDFDLLPDGVRSLESERFRIRTCEDIRNFKKIIPSLAENPDAFIVIADDDTYYPEDWLRGLVDTYLAGPPAIIFYRGHGPTYDENGRFAPYRDWVRNSAEQRNGVIRQDILATGNGGVLYPPGSLPPQTADLELIRRLSATSDDVWLYFMRRQSGFPIRRVPGPKREFIEWSGTQQSSLTSLHLTGKKDEHLQAMSDYFGVPARL